MMAGEKNTYCISQRSSMGGSFIFYFMLDEHPVSWCPLAAPLPYLFHILPYPFSNVLFHSTFLHPKFPFFCFPCHLSHFSLPISLVSISDLHFYLPFIQLWGMLKTKRGWKHCTNGEVTGGREQCQKMFSFNVTDSKSSRSKSTRMYLVTLVTSPLPQISKWCFRNFTDVISMLILTLKAWADKIWVRDHWNKRLP